MNNASVSMRDKQLFETLLLIPEYEIRSAIARSHGNCIFYFSEEAPYCFPQWLFHFTFPPTGNRGSGFSTCTPTPVFWFGGNSYPDRCELVAHCSFD